MSGFIRQINASDGEPITAPTSVGISVSSWVVFANDAAYEAVYGAGSIGKAYYNSTELLIREHNGIQWVYGQNGINGLEDSASTGSSQDLDPTYHNLLQVSNAGLTSVRSINDAQTSICYLVNNVGGDITLLHNSGTAPAGQALLLPGAENFLLEEGNVAHFVKDTITDAWRYTNAAGSGGGSGTGTGAKNYVLSPDSSTSVTDVGGSVSSDITDVALIPEESKGVAVLVTQTAGAIGNTSTWETNAIDEGDGGSNGAAEWYWKTQAGYVDDAASIQWYNSDTSTVVYSQDIKAGTGRISKGMVDLPLTTAQNIKPRIYWNVTSETNGIAVSGAGTLAETRLVGDGGVKQYESVADSITVTPSTGTLSRAVFVPYRTVDGAPRCILNITVTSMTGSSSTVTITGLTSVNAGLRQAIGTGTTSAPSTRNINAYIAANTSIITVNTDDTTLSTVALSGDIELESWPTWADFDGSMMFGTEAQAQNARGRWYRDAAYAYTASTTFDFDTEDITTFDPALGITNASGVFTVDSAGTYDITASAGDNGNWAAGSFIEVRVDRGSGLTRERIIGRLPTSAGVYISGNCAIKLDAGDSFDVTISDGASVIVGSATSYIEIERRSDKSSKATGFPILGDSTTGTQDIGTVVKQDPTADIGGAPSQSDFNNLLQKLRDAGVLDT